MKTWLFHKWERIPPDWQPSNWDIIFFLPADLERNIHSSRVWSLLVFGLEIPHHFSWVSGCQTWTGTDTISSPGSLASNSSYRSGELSASVTIWANSLHILYTSYIYIFIYTHYMHTHTHLISSVSLENHDEYTIFISVVKYLSYPFPVAIFAVKWGVLKTVTCYSNDSYLHCCSCQQWPLNCSYQGQFPILIFLSSSIWHSESSSSVNPPLPPWTLHTPGCPPCPLLVPSLGPCLLSSHFLDL